MPSRFLPLLLTLSLIPCCVEVDISVPSFPDMTKHFNVSEGMIQLTLAYNFLGFCLGGLIYGPLSDCYGRRRVMIWGNGLLVLGAAGCIFAPSIYPLLGARFLQGIGAATAAVVAFAIATDVYQGEKAVKLIGFMNAVLTALMAIAPVVGGFVNQTIGWRGSYTLVAIICFIAWLLLFLMLPETKKELDTLSLNKVVKDYATLLRSSKFWQMSLIPSISCAGYFSFVACGSFLYMETFGLSVLAYACHQGSVVAAFSVMSLMANRIVQTFGASKSIIIGTLGLFFASFGLVLVSLLGPSSPYSMTFFMVMFALGSAITYPIIFPASLEIFPNIKGTASSAVMGMRSLVMSFFIGITAYFYNGHPIVVALVISSCTVLAGLLTIQLLRIGGLENK